MRQQGAFAIGVDLNPGPKNRYVVVGDFHDLQFVDDSVDCVYTNSLDHAFALDKILAEVHRVLRPGGHFIVEAQQAAASGEAAKGPYEAMVWSGAEALIKLLEDAGFTLEARHPFAQPWAGQQLILRPAVHAI